MISFRTRRGFLINANYEKTIGSIGVIRRRTVFGAACLRVDVDCCAHPKPLKKRQNKNGQKNVRKLEIILNKPSTSSAAIRAFFRPCISAIHPQKYAPKSMPAKRNKNGAYSASVNLSLYIYIENRSPRANEKYRVIVRYNNYTF